MARRVLTVACALCVAALAAACGSQSVQLAEDDPDYEGAVLFADKCGGCHTLKPAGTQGSVTKVTDRERTDGPNFDTRQVTLDDVLYAIRNGGYSGAIMPENIVTGDEAQQVARFLSKHSGQERAKAAKSGG